MPLKSLLTATLALLTAFTVAVHAQDAGDPPHVTPSPVTASPAPSGHIQFKIRRGEVPCRGVNLGSWLVAEHWMSWSSPLWEGVPKNVSAQGEFATMKFLGQVKGDAAFQQHWATWITEDDFAKIANASLNTVRIPVGFWIRYDDPVINHREVYYPKGSLRYLDLAIQWGEKYNLAVLLSLHAHQGSQNGFQHSAPYELRKANWSDSPVNVQNSVDLAVYLAARYRSSPAFLGLGLMNEPSLPTDPSTVQSYYKRAYAAIRNGSAASNGSYVAIRNESAASNSSSNITATNSSRNDCVLIVSPMLGAQDPNALANFMVDAQNTTPPVYYNVWHDVHNYYIGGFGSSSEMQLLDAVKSFRESRVDTWRGNPLFVGEWSMQSGIPLSSNETFREFGKTQRESYASLRAGWTFWSWRHSDEANMRTGWSLRRLLKDGDMVI